MVDIQFEEIKDTEYLARVMAKKPSQLSPKGNKQPFPRLPSYPVAATLLSYLGYAWQIKQLLYLLSKNGKNYWQKHRGFLKSFVFFRESKPFFGIRELFFPPNNCKYFSWPSNVNLQKLQQSETKMRHLKLKTDRFITGI